MCETRGGYRPNSGRKAGYISEKRKYCCPTKVAKVPKCWNVMDVHESLEMIQSLMEDARQQIEDSREASAKNGKGLNSRLHALDSFLQELENNLPNKCEG